ncbi:ABC transporter ATP-binding protein [Roseivirga sp. E12]|uniref:ATP-binding cassette domain-containing protein n=1 Tax=Roseivirga sp. E12 TaxID=2819237 RepID=UPI001ABC36F3|nr:ABC transporter ATP-binding protein [Roseivirga sp. E12]
MKTIAKSIKLLTSRQRRQLTTHVLLFVFNTFLELFTLGTAIPLIVYQIGQSQGNDESFGAFKFLADSMLFQVEVIPMLLILFVLLLLKNSFGSLISAYQIRTCFQVANALCRSLVEKYFLIDYPTYSQSNTGTLTQEINYLPITFAQKILTSIIHLASECVVIILISIVLLILTPEIFLLTAGFFLLCTALALYAKNKITNKIDIGLRHQLTKTTKNLMVALDSFVQVRLYKRESYFLETFMDEYKIQNRFFAKSQFLQTMSVRILEVAAFAGILIVVAWFLSGDFKPAELALSLGLYATAAYRLIPSLNRIINAITAISSSKHSVELLHERLDETHFDKINYSPIADCIDKIEVRELSVYNGDQILFKNLSFTVNKGEVLGIMGPSGFGKSSLLRVLSGLSKTYDGELLINDKQTGLYNNPNWFSHMAYLDQQPLILDTSIAENLTFGGERDEARLWEVLSQVGLKTWSQSKKQGLDSQVGENGLMMSGGEKRRLAFARTLYHDPDVYFIDELTNDLDIETTQMIHDLIRKLSDHGKIIIWVSHDPLTKELCDQVLDLGNNI